MYKFIWYHRPSHTGKLVRHPIEPQTVKIVFYVAECLDVYCLGMANLYIHFNMWMKLQIQPPLLTKPHLVLKFRSECLYKVNVNMLTPLPGLREESKNKNIHKLVLAKDLFYFVSHSYCGFAGFNTLDFILCIWYNFVLGLQDIMLRKLSRWMSIDKKRYSY